MSIREPQAVGLLAAAGRSRAMRASLPFHASRSAFPNDGSRLRAHGRRNARDARDASGRTGEVRRRFEAEVGSRRLNEPWRRGSRHDTTIPRARRRTGVSSGSGYGRRRVSLRGQPAVRHGILAGQSGLDAGS